MSPFAAVSVLLPLAAYGLRTEVKLRSHEQDLSALSSDFYLSFNPGIDIHQNAHQAFEHFASKAGLKEELTEDEKELYEARFEEEVEYEAKFDNLFGASPDEQEGIWQKEIRRALEDQKPAATEQLVKEINERKLGWTAKKK